MTEKVKVFSISQKEIVLYMILCRISRGYFVFILVQILKKTISNFNISQCLMY